MHLLYTRPYMTKLVIVLLHLQRACTKKRMIGFI